MKKSGLWFCRRIPWIFLVGLALLYVFSAHFAINFSRLLGMLVYGDAKGVEMYYYLAGQWGAAPLAFGIGMLQALFPLISKAVVVGANSGYFGSAAGFFLSAGGFVVGAAVAFSFGRTFNGLGAKIIGRSLSLAPEGFPAQALMAAIISAACLLPASWLQLIFYLAGLAGIPWRIYLPAAEVSGSLAYLLLIMRI